ncbi:hypothetical protein ACTQX5_04960 [Faecalicoccus sp. LCP19S3_E3]|uniref:hypothetical protein n=1 Tax=unclassified Faecalicoccus TaxID=2643311 RepID=UPI0025F293CF|nr:hypothetical protein [uncultured Faecalicoccus sp.]
MITRLKTSIRLLLILSYSVFTFYSKLEINSNVKASPSSITTLSIAGHILASLQTVLFSDSKTSHGPLLMCDKEALEV